MHRLSIPSLLKTCTSQLDLSHGKRIHAAVLQMALQFDPYIASSLVTMYARCGSISDAYHVFDQIPHRDATVHNAMISASFRHDHRTVSLSLFRQLQSSGARADGHSLSILLTACNRGSSDLELGKQAHAYVVRNALDGDPFLSTALIDMYAKCGAVSDAYRVFVVAGDKKNVFAWNAMIAGFSQIGSWEESLELFVSLRREGTLLQSATLSSVLTACSVGEDADFGEGIHCCAIKSGLELDPYVCTSLLTVYSRCRLIHMAHQVFHQAPLRGIELWNSMISAYVANACAYEALDLYKKMKSSCIRCDHITISNALTACSLVGLLEFGRTVHGEIIKQHKQGGLVMQSSLITMYMRSGSVESAEALFNSIKDCDVVIWGSMISGLCQNDKFDHALYSFNQMRAEGVKADSTVITSAASACASLKCLGLGFQIHGHAVKSGMNSDVFVGSALIYMYAKCGVKQSAESMILDMPFKNLAVWNCMISGYSHSGLVDQAILGFCQISRHGLIPDSISITSVLASVSSVAALMKGKMIHGYQVRSGILCDIHAENALLDMYVKCGSLRHAQCLFERMPLSSVVTWNTMISGFETHGHCTEAFKLFREMQRSDVSPDGATFLSLISSCSHSGLVEEGLALFQTMTTYHHIAPCIEHYANIVDLLGRAGRLNDAYCFIRDMPIRSDESVWLSLLSACRTHGAADLEEVVADHMLKLIPEDSGSYTQLLNFYGEKGLWEKVAGVKVQMREAGVKKNPGCSWLEMKDSVVVFYSGDSSSPITTDIHEILINLRRTMRQVDEFE